ncbi:recombinase family protein [Galbibacter pacificus]|uniref:Recombinase family protein n=1 Tax=Galbibacter pacificus TaxID=2996052 RepID=A0ABT6FR85_9FLAO|nr:recombinase family protein [Galbibacter pacificus]MDG3581748.1 recombinase family protein [Galbibacter pacificus]MDG3585778.1 recombinase family protein [Galbibacter pacificus]
MLAIYVRLSKEDEDSNSINNQLNEGKDFAKTHKLKYKIYNEGEGVSGTLDIAQRPQLQLLMNEINSGVITSVWMRNQNRLDRNSLTFAFFVDIAKKNNIDVYFGNNEKLDFNNPTTLLTTSILSNLNQYQAQLQSYQTKNVIQKKVSEGKTHGIIPLGYKKDDNGYMVVDDDEAKFVNEIFQLYLKNNDGVQFLCNKLNDEERLTRNGKQWKSYVLWNLLHNTTYIGKRLFKNNIYECPAIIDKGLFDAVQKKLSNSQSSTGKKVTHRYLLKGLLKCGKCGRNYNGRINKKAGDKHYICASVRSGHKSCGNRRLDIDKMENFIFQLIINNSWLIDKVKDEYKHDDDKLKRLKADITTYNNNITAYNKKKNKAIRMTVDGLIDEKDIKAIINDYDSSIEAEKQKIKDVENIINNITNSNKLINSIEEDINDLSNKLTFKEKKEILNKYINSITTTDNKTKKEYHININFKIDVEMENFIIDFKYENYILLKENMIFKFNPHQKNYGEPVFELMH